MKEGRKSPVDAAVRRSPSDAQLGSSNSSSAFRLRITADSRENSTRDGSMYNEAEYNAAKAAEYALEEHSLRAGPHPLAGAQAPRAAAEVEVEEVQRKEPLTLRHWAATLPQKVAGEPGSTVAPRRAGFVCVTGRAPYRVFFAPYCVLNSHCS
jgi:hypothetical protein